MSWLENWFKLPTPEEACRMLIKRSYSVRMVKPLSQEEFEQCVEDTVKEKSHLINELRNEPSETIVRKLCLEAEKVFNTHPKRAAYLQQKRELLACIEFHRQMLKSAEAELNELERETNPESQKEKAWVTQELKGDGQ